MRLAVIGAGPIAGLSARLALWRGHKVAMLPPRRRLRLGSARGGRLAFGCSGALDGAAEVALLDDPGALADWPVLLAAIPADAYLDVLGPIARTLSSGQTVICSGALSLLPLWLADRAAAVGAAPAIVAWGTTLGTGRILPDRSLKVGTLRARLAQAAMPAARAEALLGLTTALFGERFTAADSLLQISLSNINPVAHAGQVIANLSRIDRAEAWQLFANFTASGARIAEAIDAERVAIAAAFGVHVHSLAEHYRLSYHVAGESVAAIAAAIEAAGRGPRGPAALRHRYLDEDMPFGLAVYETLGSIAAVPTPATSAAITLLSVAAGRDFRRLNPIRDELGLASMAPAELIARAGGAG